MVSKVYSVFLALLIPAFLPTYSHARGSATDAEDGTLPASAFSWTIRFHHGTHFHPFLGPIDGVRSGTFTIPQVGETSANVWYKIILTVTDSDGVSTQIERDVFPRTSNVTITTSPPGL